MTPLSFEALYQAEWQELETLLERLMNGPKGGEAVHGERVAALYRRACEHLALARARAYPAYLLDRLERLTADAHQLIYQRRELGANAVWRFAAREFPRAVRAAWRYVAVAALVFAGPLLVVAVLVYLRPELVLSLVDAETAASFEDMYAQGSVIGRTRAAGSDWSMFGYYIRNNIGIAFQCFAGGLFAGLGSLFFLAYNGAVIGGVAGYVTQRGLGATFYSFVVTHGAFELTAIVLSGAAGLKLGHSLVAPGRRSRADSLVAAARESVVLVYGAAAMLLVAAVIEAFWSSAGWLPPVAKYGVAAVCWTGVLAYLTLQGRRAR